MISSFNAPRVAAIMVADHERRYEQVLPDGSLGKLHSTNGSLPSRHMLCSLLPLAQLWWKLMPSREVMYQCMRCGGGIKDVQSHRVR